MTSMLLDFLTATLLHSKQAAVAAAQISIVTVFLAAGCALTDVPTRAISDLSDAKTRKEVAQLAKNDPFPSASDVSR